MGAHPWLQNQLLVELSHLTFFQNGYIKGLSPCFENRTYYFESVILLFVCIHIFLAVPSMYPCRVSTAVREVPVCAKLLQSCPTLCEPMDYSPPGSSVHGILQARILEWAAMPSSRGSSQPRDWTGVSYVSCIGRQGLFVCLFLTTSTWEVRLQKQALILKCLNSSFSHEALWW